MLEQMVERDGLGSYIVSGVNGDSFFMNLDLIDDETLDSIPDGDPGHAFASIERACRKTMLEATRGEEEWRAVQEYRLDYMHDVLAAAQYYDIPGLRDYKLPTRKSYDDDHFEDFSRRVRFFVMQLRLNAKTQRGAYSVELIGSHRERMRTLLHHLKEVVDRSDLSDHRKADLHKRIRDFEVALQAKRLSFTEAMVFLAVLGSGLHGAGEGVEGAHKVIHEITVMIGGSKEAEDRRTAPQPQINFNAPIYLIEDKAPRLVSGEEFSADLDDEIPF